MCSHHLPLPGASLSQHRASRARVERTTLEHAGASAPDRPWARAGCASEGQGFTATREARRRTRRTPRAATTSCLQRGVPRGAFAPVSREGQSAPLGSAACGANSLGRRRASVSSGTVKTPANETDISSRNGISFAIRNTARGVPRGAKRPPRQCSLRRKLAGEESSERNLSHSEASSERDGHLEPQRRPANTGGLPFCKRVSSRTSPLSAAQPAAQTRWAGGERA
jgi:hypothetical protein